MPDLTMPEEAKKTLYKDLDYEMEKHLSVLKEGDPSTYNDLKERLQFLLYDAWVIGADNENYEEKRIMHDIVLKTTNYLNWIKDRVDLYDALAFEIANENTWKVQIEDCDVGVIYLFEREKEETYIGLYDSKKMKEAGYKIVTAELGKNPLYFIEGRMISSSIFDSFKEGRK